MMFKSTDWRFLGDIYNEPLLSLVVQRRVDHFDEHPIVVEKLPVVVFPALACVWLRRNVKHSVRGLAETRWQ